ncbi:glutamate 5-kinase [Rhodobium gokarnense]|uniref:Glutamate 5-kinase n=1 Tax=Rhodobium gokarnense TaxID=364296 RepID=A0ABT3HEJ2_9HYPH|nr:glutamate 5-kinase [Rhodobium gokarnense]MCW2308820.1 glutamate 5-kinase [Rhodobium gokarnense]
MVRKLTGFRRIVVKIGSSLLVDAAKGNLRRTWLESLADDISDLHDAGVELVIVSSGAIALGRHQLRLHPGELLLEEAQAAAAVGQISLARAYTEALRARGLLAGQILLTPGDTEQRRRYLNARQTVDRLLGLGAIPVVNENDTVSTAEIRYGDNDRLAARVALMTSADCLVLLSDIDGLYTAPPAQHPDAEFLAEVPAITAEIEAMAGAAGSELSRGGMKTKIEAGRIATSAGTSMVIASGKTLHPLTAISSGARATWFPAPTSPVTSRKKWIAGQLKIVGSVTIDAGAVTALRSGKSLLPAGVVSVAGSFRRGDAVILRDPTGHEVGRGLIAYDRDDAERLAGRKSGDIEAILGYRGRSEMIHRDDMVLHGEEIAATDVK